MGTVRFRLTLFACLAALCLAAPVGPASAAGHGGATAPEARSVAGASGGTVAGQHPTSGRRTQADRRRRARRRAARRRARRNTAVAPAPVAPALPGTETGHHFPVAGPYDLGGEGARFGAPRGGRLHEGQDISAAEGTPVVAPYAGTVEFVRFQASGAGWYIVLDSHIEDRDYVFMHLRAGSLLVAAGQAVSAGQPLAQVGNTGNSSAPHLHFEVWVGGWYAGGAPIDPLPLLQAWAGIPAAATRSRA
jgi:murein DD-endopeptidase MepM/ murein hydrolase activator NlpD